VIITALNPKSATKGNRKFYGNITADGITCAKRKQRDHRYFKIVEEFSTLFESISELASDMWDTKRELITEMDNETFDAIL
ncbi:hypothetical protein Tco_1178482, partial [Tanacetum coccineum]